MENDVYVDDPVILKKRIAKLERRNDDLHDKLVKSITEVEEYREKLAALRNKHGILWNKHEALKYHFKIIKKAIDNYSFRDLRGHVKDEDLILYDRGNNG